MARVTHTSPKEWDLIVQQFQGYTVFHSLAWLKSIEQCYQIRLSLLSLREDDDYLAAWPVFEQRKGPLRIAGSPLPGWSTVYLGPLFAKHSDAESAIDAFLKTPPLKGAAYTYCKVVEQGHGVDLKRHGFIGDHIYKTYLLDLTEDENQLWKNLKKGCKSSTKKAMKAGVEVHLEGRDEFLKDFWKMSVEVFSRSGIRPNYSMKLLRNLWHALSEKNNVIALSAFLKNKRIATVFLPCTDSTMYYWAGASYGHWRNLGANNLLQWEAIKLARQRGIECYDLVSIYGSAGKFKGSFGATIHSTAMHWERYRYPWIKYAKNTYKRWLTWRAKAR